MTSRYYVAPPLSVGEVCLDDAEARHCFSVMRAKEGDSVELFDGQGRSAVGQLVQCDRKKVAVAIEQIETQRPSAKSLHLLVSLPKGDRQKWLVEKCVELDVAKLTPLITSRSVAQPTEKALERLRRVVVEASKQCRRNYLMEVAKPLGFSEALNLIRDEAEFWIAHPYDSRPLADLPITRSCNVLIGPEGGFSDEETEEAKTSGWQSVSLGQNILRVETAALTVAALHFAS